MTDASHLNLVRAVRASCGAALRRLREEDFAFAVLSVGAATVVFAVCVEWAPGAAAAVCVMRRSDRVTGQPDKSLWLRCRLADAVAAAPAGGGASPQLWY